MTRDGINHVLRCRDEACETCADVICALVVLIERGDGDELAEIAAFSPQSAAFVAAIQRLSEQDASEALCN